jgi:tetratricopeptide (TPR) repeat protein
MQLAYRTVTGITGAITIGLCVVAASALIAARDTRGRVPLSADTVVAHLKTGATAYSGGLRAALQAQRANPADMALATAAARALIAEGRVKGDSRLVGAALPILHPFMDATEPAFLAATARQYQHDFPGALALLDRVVQSDPRDVNALLTRATVNTVLGHTDLAMADCARISALQRPDVGFLCAASAQTLTTAAPVYAARLAAITAQPGVLDPALLPWATSLMGEIAMLQGDVAGAKALLTRVIADDPAALREQMMLADILLAQGRAADVLSLLQAAPDTDGILIRRVLAQGDADGSAQRTLATRAQRSLDLGLAAHAREEGQYYLLIAKDAPKALERAQANWALQHEFDDAQLLLLAADAAGTPAAARPVLTWMADRNIRIPALKIPASITAAQP